VATSRIYLNGWNLPPRSPLLSVSDSHAGMLHSSATGCRDGETLLLPEDGLVSRSNKTETRSQHARGGEKPYLGTCTYYLLAYLTKYSLTTYPYRYASGRTKLGSLIRQPNNTIVVSSSPSSPSSPSAAAAAAYKLLRRVEHAEAETANRTVFQQVLAL
jgi:hypothetical protein